MVTWLNHPLNPRPPLSSPFGFRRHPVTGKSAHHNGSDYPAPEGTPVLAPRGGRVRFVNEHPSGGTQLGIDLDDGSYVGFAHLSMTLAAPGQEVAAGHVVALTGNTGASTGPHLHITARDADGQLVDPDTIPTAGPPPPPPPIPLAGLGLLFSAVKAFL